MGVSTLDEALPTRPHARERLPVCEALPGQKFIWVETYRNPETQGNWFGRHIARPVIRLLCWIGNTTTPAPYDLMGAELTEEAACRHCDDPNWSVIALPLGRTFPKEHIRWKWNWSPRRWNWNRERNTVAPLYEPVEVRAVEALAREIDRARRAAAGSP